MSIMSRIPVPPEIQTILKAWSRMLLLDAQSGESIVTETDLHCLATILCHYIENAHHHSIHKPSIIR
jgi:hypothetical protein